MIGQLQVLAALLPWEKPQYPLDTILVEPQSRSGWRGKNFWPYRNSNSDPSVVQPVASRYTDYAIWIQ
jgi:hypothetical protein